MDLVLCPDLNCNRALETSTVYIYAGPGVSRSSLMQTENTVNSFLASKYPIRRILPDQIINDDWDKRAVLLIIPGGADIPYTKALNGKGNQKIRSYVERGGAFLGICAGSYYGGAFVDFAKDTDLEVQGTRELSFFSGIVRGPVLAPFDYLNESGARAAFITWNNLTDFQKNTIFSLYYNGGGYFVDAKKKPCVNVLACYDIGDEFPAIIECDVGLGKAILSGVHFEYDPKSLDPNNDHLKSIIPNLKKQNSNRLELVKYILNRLNVNF